MLNPVDQTQLDRMMANPEFMELFGSMMAFAENYRQRTGTIQAVAPLWAKDVKDGKGPAIMSIVNKPNADTADSLQTFSLLLLGRAAQLASYFPERAHRRWERIFVALAYRGRGTISQRHNGADRNEQLDQDFETWQASGYDSKALRQILDECEKREPNRDRRNYETQLWNRKRLALSKTQTAR